MEIIKTTTNNKVDIVRATNTTNTIQNIDSDKVLTLRDVIIYSAIDEEGKETEYQNVELIQQVKYKDGWYLAFIEKNISEQDRINAQIMLQIAQLKAELKAVK